jgi:hypothetical protein
MVMSVVFDNQKCFGNFCVPPLVTEFTNSSKGLKKFLGKFCSNIHHYIQGGSKKITHIIFAPKWYQDDEGDFFQSGSPFAIQIMYNVYVYAWYSL